MTENTELAVTPTTVLEEQSIGTACVATMGGTTVYTDIYAGMTLTAVLESAGFTTGNSEQVTMNGIVVREPGKALVGPNAIIVIAGRVSNG